MNVRTVFVRPVSRLDLSGVQNLLKNQFSEEVESTYGLDGWSVTVLVQSCLFVSCDVLTRLCLCCHFVHVTMFSQLAGDYSIGFCGG